MKRLVISKYKKKFHVLTGINSYFSQITVQKTEKKMKDGFQVSANKKCRDKNLAFGNTDSKFTNGIKRIMY